MYSSNDKYKLVSAALIKIGIANDKIKPDTNFKLDLNFNDFDWNLFLNKMELFLNIELSNDNLKYSDTIKDLIRNISNLIGENQFLRPLNK